MINIGGSYALQDWTFDSDNQGGEYYSPAGTLPAGTFKKGGPNYGIECKMRPLNDISNQSNYGWAELYLGWSDDTWNYNISIDQFSDNQTSGAGDVVYGRNSYSKAMSGIDWSVAHTIFIGHRASGPVSIFDFYLDGVIKKTVVEGSIARDRSGWAFLQDRVSFGDGVSGTGIGSSD